MIRYFNIFFVTLHAKMSFRFKQFTIGQDGCAMKVGTDGVLLGAWANGGSRVLDVGTGTGVIAMMMAQRFPCAQVTALDIDSGAVRQANENILAVGWQERITVLHQSVQEYAQLSDSKGLFDAVVSNPPFFIHALNAPDAQRNLARHADSLPYAALMEAAWHLLKTDGELSVVVPFDYRRWMEDEAIFRGFFLNRECAVKTTERKPARRYLLAFRKHPCVCDREILTIGDDRYQTLIRDFYL